MKKAKPLTQKEQDKILAYLLTSRNPERDRAIFMVQLKLGLRVGTVSKLKWSHFYSPRMKMRQDITIEKQILKCQREDLHTYNNPILMHYLHLHFLKNFTTRSDFLFRTTKGLPFTVGNLKNWICKVFRQVDIERSAHSLRKKFAIDITRSFMLAGGSLNDTRIMLGHADISDTQAYLGNDAEFHRKIAMGF